MKSANVSLTKSFRQVTDLLQPHIREFLNAVQYEPSLLGLHCPLGFPGCAKLKEIGDEYSKLNIFVGIPYSNYAYEEGIREVIGKAGLCPRLAKDRNPKCQTHNTHDFSIRKSRTDARMKSTISNHNSIRR